MKQAPLVKCATPGCPSRRRTWREVWTCGLCLERSLGREPGEPTVRELVRRRNGRCLVCGLNPCGCEFGPGTEAA